MTFTQIEYFIEVAKCKNFTKASKNLFISQQVVSKQILALEKELNLKLFERNKKNVELTKSGELLFFVWDKMLAETSEAITTAKNIAAQNKITLKIGINEVPSIIDFMMPKLKLLGEKNPNINIDYELGYAVSLGEKIEDNSLDLIVTFSSELVPYPNINFFVINTMHINLAINTFKTPSSCK